MLEKKEKITENPTNLTENKFILKLEKKIFPILGKLNKIKFLEATRLAVFSAFPVIIAGFLIFSLLGNGGVPAKERLLKSFSASLGLLGVWVSFYLPFAYSKKDFHIYGILSGILSFLSFIILFPKISLKYREIVYFLIMLSQGGIIFAFIIGGLFISIRKFLQKESDQTLVAGTGILFIGLLFVSILIKKNDIDIFCWINLMIKPFLNGADTLPAAITVVFLMSLFWLSGIHGTGVVGGIVLPFYIVLFNANVAASTSNSPLPYIVTPPFFMWCMPGGTGATLPLCVYMLFSKSTHLKKVGKISILPGLVNINEPIVFGAPLILNPIIAIPFVFTPVILAIVNYSALAFNLVDRIFILPLFAIPSPIYAYFATLDPRAVILIIIDLIIAFVFYYPFFKAFEKSQIAIESTK